MDNKEQLERNKAVVARFNKAYIEGGDVQVCHDILDPSFINHTALPGMSPGIDGILRTIDMFRQAFPDLTVVLHEQVAEGDLVVTRKTFYATHAGPFMGVAATGKAITIETIDIIRLRDGKYIEHWAARDMLKVLQQLKD